MTKHWPAWIAAFFLWGLAALSASYWVAQITGTSNAPVAAAANPTGILVVRVDDLARVLGPATAAGPSAVLAGPDPAAQMRLIGVVATRRHSGVALISVDGQPAQPFRVGTLLDGGYTLQHVATRSATLRPSDPGAALVTLDLVEPDTTTNQPQLAPAPVVPRAAVTGATRRTVQEARNRKLLKEERKKNKEERNRNNDK